MSLTSKLFFLFLDLNRRHKELMQLFFTNAAFMLAPRGLIYVSHKCGTPYDDWNLEEQAKPNGLVFLGVTPFYSSNFPGYKHRRGAGAKAREIFKLGKATTYIFEIRSTCHFFTLYYTIINF